MLKAYNQIQDLDEETLASDEEFLSDAYMFLQEREGIEGVLTPDEVYDRFMEHMRFHDTNEVTTLRDLEYAQNASLEGKQNFARLIDAYDKVDTNMSWKMVGDYAESIARAPSTYIGLISGGTGKAASVAATQVAKLGVRQLLSKAATSAVGRAAIAEGSIGAVQGALGEATRVTTGAQEEFTGVRTAVSGVGNAIGAGLLTGGVQAVGKLLPKTKLDRDARQRAADELLAKSDLAETERAKQASELSKKVLEATKKTNPDKVKKLKERINAIDPNTVAVGRKLKQDLMEGSTMEAALGSEVTENIMAAAIRVIDELEIKEVDGVLEPITETVVRVMREGKLGEMTKVSEILEEHNLTIDQFSYIYAAELSDSARKLQQAGQIKSAGSAFAKLSRKNMSPEELEVDTLLKQMDELYQLGASSISREQAMQMVDVQDKSKFMSRILKAYKTSQDLDRMGISFMTAQPATTMRNNEGGVFRTAIDATTRVMDNAVEKVGFVKSSPQEQRQHLQRNLLLEFGLEEATDIMRQADANPQLMKALFNKYGRSVQQRNNIFSGAADNAKYMFNQAEARLVRQLFKKNFPEEADRLFREQADLVANVGKESPMAWAGRKINILNTASDNFFKQGILAASIKRRLADAGIDLNDVIADGRFGFIPEDIKEAAIKDAYEFTYQSGFRGTDMGSRLTRMLIESQQKFPFIVSAFMPFPRFIANQLKFQHDHMPFIGMVIPALKGKEAFREALPKQMTGVALLGTAIAWRAKQGENAEWFEIKKSDDYYINGKAIYGPLAPFMVLADAIYRGFNDKAKFPENWTKYYSKALAEATIGSTFRTGAGLQLLDSVFNDDLFSGEKDFMKIIGNVLGRYTIPAGVAKDLYSQFDPQSRLIPATNTGEEEPWFEYVYKVATRNLPDVPLASWTGDTLTTRDYDEPAVSPFITGPLKAVNPLEKQLFGFTTVRKNAIQKEMGRLGMMYTDLYKRPSNDRIDFYTRQELSRAGQNNYNMERALTTLINSPEYKTYGPARQRAALADLAGEMKDGALDIAKGRLDREANRRGKPYSVTTMAAWNDLSRNQKKQVNELFAETYGNPDSELYDPFYENKRIEDVMDETLQDSDGNDINALVWGVGLGKGL
jgi:hypothetical protein